jgi:hypothetical protein
MIKGQNNSCSYLVFQKKSKRIQLLFDDFKEPRPTQAVPDGYMHFFLSWYLQKKANTPRHARKKAHYTTGSLHLHNVLLWSW